MGQKYAVVQGNKCDQTRVTLFVAFDIISYHVLLT